MRLVRLTSLIVLTVIFSIANADESPNRAPAALRRAAAKRRAAPPPPIEPIRVAGAGVGTVLGFGLGHPFQGRWLERGWMFTGSELVGVMLLVQGGFMADCATGAGCGDSTKANLGGALFIGARILETIDLWTHLRAQPKSCFALVPILKTEEKGFALVISF